MARRNAFRTRLWNFFNTPAPRNPSRPDLGLYGGETSLKFYNAFRLFGNLSDAVSFMSLDSWLQDDLFALMAEEGWQDWNRKLPDARQLPKMEDLLGPPPAQNG